MSGLVVLVWAMLIALTFLLSFILREIVVLGTLEFVAASILRLVAGLLLAVLWLGIWKQIASIYLWRSLRRPA